MNDNGRVKLTWPQVVWIIGTIVMLVSGWADIRAQIGSVRQEIAARSMADDKEYGRIWEAIRDRDRRPRR